MFSLPFLRDFSIVNEIRGTGFLVLYCQLVLNLVPLSLALHDPLQGSRPRSDPIVCGAFQDAASGFNENFNYPIVPIVKGYITNKTHSKRNNIQQTTDLKVFKIFLNFIKSPSIF